MASASMSPSVSPSPSPSASPSQVASADVSYTIRDRVRIQKKYLVHAAISFGGGPSLYATGGIALTTAKLGFRRDIDSLVVLESNGTGLMFELDRSANKIRIFFPTQETGSSANRAGVELTANSSSVPTCALEVKAIGW